MTKFRKTYEKGTYDFRDAQCIERECFQPGTYQTRGGVGSGSRATGSESKCCMRRAYHGCPTEAPTIVELGKQRRADGWKKVS